MSQGRALDSDAAPVALEVSLPHAGPEQPCGRAANGASPTRTNDRRRLGAAAVPDEDVLRHDALASTVWPDSAAICAARSLTMWCAIRPASLALPAMSIDAKECRKGSPAKYKPGGDGAAPRYWTG